MILLFTSACNAESEKAKPQKRKCSGFRDWILWNLNVPGSRDPDAIPISLDVERAHVAPAVWRRHRHGVEGVGGETRICQCIDGCVTLSEFAGILSGKMKCKVKFTAGPVGFESIRPIIDR